MRDNHARAHGYFPVDARVMVLGRGWKRSEAFGATRQVVVIAVVELWNVSIMILRGRVRISSWDWGHTLATVVAATTVACVDLTAAGIVWSTGTLLRS